MRVKPGITGPLAGWKSKAYRPSKSILGVSSSRSSRRLSKYTGPAGLSPRISAKKLMALATSLRPGRPFSPTYNWSMGSTSVLRPGGTSVP